MNKKRLQFDFTEEALQELDALQQATGLSTRAELIRHALRFLQWGLDQTQEQGATLLVEKAGRMREVVFPFWRANTKEGGENESQKRHKEAAARHTHAHVSH